MKFIKYNLLVIITIIFFVRCINDPIDKNEKICYSYDWDQVRKLGEMHNETIKAIYSEVEISECEDCKDEMTPIFNSICVDKGYTNQECLEFISFSIKSDDYLNEIDYNFENWNSHPFSLQVFDYLIEIQTTLTNSSNYEYFKNKMIELQQTVISDNNINCIDTDLLVGTIEIAKESAYLWMPNEMGGLALNYVEHEIDYRNGWSWQGAVAGDVAGSASYFMGLGIGGAIGLFVPGSNGAIIGGWGFAAAGASLWGGVNNQPCP